MPSGQMQLGRWRWPELSKSIGVRRCLRSTPRSAATAAPSSRVVTSVSLAPATCRSSLRMRPRRPRQAAPLPLQPGPVAFMFLPPFMFLPLRHQFLSPPVRAAALLAVWPPRPADLGGTRPSAQVGKISPIILSDSGYHIIFRTK